MLQLEQMLQNDPREFHYTFVNLHRVPLALKSISWGPAFMSVLKAGSLSDFTAGKSEYLEGKCPTST